MTDLKTQLKELTKMVDNLSMKTDFPRGVYLPMRVWSHIHSYLREPQGETKDNGRRLKSYPSLMSHFTFLSPLNRWEDYDEIREDAMDDYKEKRNYMLSREDNGEFQAFYIHARILETDWDSEDYKKLNKIQKNFGDYDNTFMIYHVVRITEKKYHVNIFKIRKYYQSTDYYLTSDSATKIFKEEKDYYYIGEANEIINPNSWYDVRSLSNLSLMIDFIKASVQIRSNDPERRAYYLRLKNWLVQELEVVDDYPYFPNLDN